MYAPDSGGTQATSFDSARDFHGGGLSASGSSSNGFSFGSGRAVVWQVPHLKFAPSFSECRLWLNDTAVGSTSCGLSPDPLAGSDAPLAMRSRPNHGCDC